MENEIILSDVPATPPRMRVYLPPSARMDILHALSQMARHREAVPSDWPQTAKAAAQCAYLALEELEQRHAKASKRPSARAALLRAAKCALGLLEDDPPGTANHDVACRLREVIDKAEGRS